MLLPIRIGVSLWRCCVLAKPDMNAMLKRRMAATQQASELQVGNEVYEKLFEPVPTSSPMICDLPLDKLE